MSRAESKAKRQNKALREQVKRTVLKQMIEYIPGWIETLGSMGALGGPAEDEKTKHQAAAMGLRLAEKFMPEGGEREGDDLMSDLQAMEKLADARSEVPDAFKE